MTIVGGAVKKASTEQSPPKVSAATSPPKGAEPVSATLSSDTDLEDFDESAYLAAFPDVAKSIKDGQFPSAINHYESYGRREGRLADSRYEALVRADTAGFPAACVDRVYGCKDGQCLVLGWVNDDGQDPVNKLVLRNALGLRGSTTVVYRYARKDVSSHVGLPEDRKLAFWAVVAIDRPESMSAPVTEVTLSAGAERKTFKCQVRVVAVERFMELALEHLGSQTVGHAPIETFRSLDAGLGRSLIALNLKVSGRIALGAQTVQIGVAPARPEASVIVCLYGKPELLRIQCALFSTCRGIENYEFIYVSNSPEMAELLIKDATIANRIYGMPITLILLPGNAGFGVANNVAANAARSARLLIVNPDVFPMDPEWPSQHSRIVNDLPPEQVALFGAPLYYDDGSLMHGGMYFEVDVEFSFRDQQATRCEMLRVEHYGKGAPPHTNPFLVSRPVPAVTGAFMSVEREWFESLGGFSPEYIYGQYEDADLCLKSFNAGKPAWLHCLPFVHFEGKGSAPRPAFGGAGLVNRWHFTKFWGEVVKESIHGPASQAFPTPAHR
jgi:GT2 family glycosyltransferase